MKFKKFLSEQRVLTEGGNAVKMSSRINQENAQATLDDIAKRLLPKLGLKVSDTASLGSTGKKNKGSSSGDIDLALDIKALMRNKKLDTMDDVFNFLMKQSKPLTKELADLRSLGLISLAWPIANGTDPEKYQPDEYVQLDLMPTDNLDWVAWSFYSPAEWESQWKGLYRNQILISIAKFLGFKITKKMEDKDGKMTDAEWSRHFFDMSQGLMSGKQSRVGKKGVVKGYKTIEKQVVAKDPQSVLDLMFGKGAYTPGEILTWDDAFKAVTSPKFPHKKSLKKILKMTYDGIKNLKKMPIPKELEKVV